MKPKLKSNAVPPSAIPPRLPANSSTSGSTTNGKLEIRLLCEQSTVNGNPIIIYLDGVAIGEVNAAAPLQDWIVPGSHVLEVRSGQLSDAQTFVGEDGQVLKWDVKSTGSSLELSEPFELTGRSMPVWSRGSSQTKSTPAGVLLSRFLSRYAFVFGACLFTCSQVGPKKADWLANILAAVFLALIFTPVTLAMSFPFDKR